MKKYRHKIILDLISEYDISTQEELLLLLREKGFDITQATVSRDIKELNLKKSLGANGIYSYSVAKKDESGYSKMLEALFNGSLVKVDYVNNICVIKCSTGLANAACAAIDNMNVSEVVGTIAGDDTIFMLCRTEEDASNVALSLKKMIKR